MIAAAEAGAITETIQSVAGVTLKVIVVVVMIIIATLQDKQSDQRGDNKEGKRRKDKRHGAFILFCIRCHLPRRQLQSANECDVRFQLNRTDTENKTSQLQCSSKGKISAS